MIIRPLERADIPQCLIVAAEAWGKHTAHVGQPDFNDAFAGGSCRPFFYVAESDGQIVGMGCHNVTWAAYGLYGLAWIAVRKAYRGQGIGKAIVERCLDDLRPVADAVMLLTSIPSFYCRWGFQTISRLNTGGSYGDHLMLLQLPVKSI